MRRTFLKIQCNVKAKGETYHCVRLVDMRYLDGQVSSLNPAHVIRNNIRLIEDELLAEVHQFTKSEWDKREWEARIITRGWG